MGILTGIAAYHNATSALTALVANRAYPITAPQNPTYPYYTFQRVSTPMRIGSHSGDQRTEQVRYQFTVNAKTAMNADTIVAALKTAFLGYRGLMGDVYVNGVTLANDLDDYDPTTGIYRRLVDMMLWYRPQA